MTKKRALRGVVCIVACLLVALTVLTCTATFYRSAINAQLGLGGDVEMSNDLMYYKSMYGDFDADSLSKLIADTKAQTIAEMQEGAVLLKNENGALPLANDEQIGRAHV